MNLELPEPTAPDRLAQSLLDAKLTARRHRPGAISRRQLIDAARKDRCRVVGVTAPAGYGKSTLLAEWAATEDRPVAWVSLDRFDNDPAALLPVLASAYAQVMPGNTELVADVRGVSVLSRAAPRLASAFATSPHPFVLMLDDLHELQTPECHDALGVVISAIPRGSQFVAASRAEQPHLPRLRASGDAFELGADDLALDAAGAQHIFSQAQVHLDAAAAAAVTEHTEGWPAGLHLAALIAKEHPDNAADAVAGADPHVADYLYTEALAQLPENTQQFLRRTAVLDQLSGPLCDAVAGTSDAHAQLRVLEAGSLFLVPLDRRREWYRYHALFRELLQEELRRCEPDLIMQLHLRAADWYESNGSPALALEHLLHTTERDRCTALTTTLVLPTYSTGQMSTVQRWLVAVGDASVEAYPPLAVLAGWVAAFTGQTTEAQRWADVVDAASFDAVPLDGTASFDSARAMLGAAMCSDGIETMLSDALFAVDHEPEWSLWRDTALGLLGEAYRLIGDLDRAGAAFAEASGLATTTGATTALFSRSGLVLLAMDSGRWPEAAEHLTSVLEAIEEHRLYDYAVAVLAFAGAARLALHRGDLADTHRQLARGMRARPLCTFVLPFLAVRLRLELAKVYVALADVTTARHLLLEIDDVLQHRPRLGTLVDEVSELRHTLATLAPGGAGGPPLSPAELRVLPYLQTHLTIPEIAARLFLSHNTVRSEVTSIYRKLGVSSRGEAMQQATEIGLLGA